MKVKKTILITGSRHSGTTVAGAILNHFGIPMGIEKLRFLNMEDQELYDAIMDGPTLKAMIKRRDDMFKMWGFKWPDLNNLQIETLVHYMTAPYLIYTFRDPIAITYRMLQPYNTPYGKRLPKHELDKMLEYGISRSQKQVDYLTRIRDKGWKQVMLYSYEKMLIRPKDFVMSLIDFVGVTPSKEQIETAINYIEPEVGIAGSRENHIRKKLGIDEKT